MKLETSNRFSKKRPDVVRMQVAASPASRLRRWFLFLLLGLLSLIIACDRHTAPNEITFWIGGELDLGSSDPGALSVLDQTITHNAIGIVTLAGPVTESVLPIAPFTLRSALPHLIANGVRFADIESEHRQKRDVEGENKTIYALRDAGIDPFGASAGVFKRQVLDFTIVFVAISAGEQSIGDAEKILRDAKTSADHLIVFLRGGNELSVAPLAEAAIKEGARILIIGGPAGAEQRAELRGNTLVVSGLRTLASANPAAAREGMILRFILSRGSIREARLYPIQPAMEGKPAESSANASGTLRELQRANPRIKVVVDHAEF